MSAAELRVRTRRSGSCRRREWAVWAAALGAAGLLFSVWPELDLMASAAFFRPGSGFVGNDYAAVRAVHEVVPWLGRGAGLLVPILLVWRRPRWLGPRWRRRLLALGLAMWLGTGLAVNGLLKEGWGRARPVAVQAFGGTATFTPALHRSDQCAHNCSFVSGHAATGYTLLALGLFGAPATRRRWLWVGAIAGLSLSLLRVMQGGHFLSDTLFSGLTVWLCCALLREAWLRLRLRALRRHAAARSGD